MLSVTVRDMPELGRSDLYLLKSLIVTEVTKIREMKIKQGEISVSFLPPKPQFSNDPVVVYLDGNFDRWMDGEKIRTEIKEKISLLISQILGAREIPFSHIHFVVHWRDNYGFVGQV
jgi:hypothetical protein